MNEERRLEKIDAGLRALAAAKSIAEVKDLRDKAEAIRLYRKQHDKSLEAQNTAAELKLRAERKLGLLLRETVNHEGSKGVGFSVKPTLPEDISKSQSHRWQTIAELPEDDFEHYLQQTQANGEELTTQAVYDLARTRAQAQHRQELAGRQARTCRITDLHALVQAGYQFSTIYADPPWQYDNQGTRAATDNHYHTLSVADIAALPVAQLATANSHLHLWTTNAFLFEAKTILEAWDFEYKGMVLWVKEKLGIGNYWRVSHEFLLLGVRGQCPFLDRSQRSWVAADRLSHSTKPEVFRRMIETVSPPPRLELFGRRLSQGWVVFGNEIEHGLFDQAIEEVFPQSTGEQPVARSAHVLQ